MPVTTYQVNTKDDRVYARYSVIVGPGQADTRFSSYSWSRAAARGGARNGLNDQTLERLAVRAAAGNTIATRALELLETGDKLTRAWAAEIELLTAVSRA